MNTLYYGDNLKILREYIAASSVDLVYLDPPFDSNRNYNVLFKDESGAEADSQITAFEDTWHWNASAEETYRELLLAGDEVSTMIESFRGFIGANQMMAYLVMMAVRLKELHRGAPWRSNRTCPPCPPGPGGPPCPPCPSHPEFQRVGQWDSRFWIANFRFRSTQIPYRERFCISYSRTFA